MQVKVLKKMNSAASSRSRLSVVDPLNPKSEYYRNKDQATISARNARGLVMASARGQAFSGDGNYKAGKKKF